MSLMTPVVLLPRADWKTAAHLFQSEVQGVSAAFSLASAAEGRAQALEALLRTCVPLGADPQIIGKTFPPTMWLGAYRGKKLLAAVHVEPAYEQAIELLGNLHLAADRRYHLGWPSAYLRSCFLVCELAVSPAERGKGLGSAMLQEVERQLKSTARTDTVIVTGSVDARNNSTTFYQRCGYVVEPRDQPIPPEAQMGVGTTMIPGLSGNLFHKRLL